MNWAKLLVDVLLAAVTLVIPAGVVVPLWGFVLAFRNIRIASKAIIQSNL